VFTVRVGGLSVPVTETVIVSWVAMVLLIAGSIILTRSLKRTPRGAQTFVEAAIEFLDNTAKAQFGKYAGIFGPYIGTVFLFLLLVNMIPMFSPLSLSIGGHVFDAPFAIKPPARDINLTAAFALVSIMLVLLGGIIVRGPVGWFKTLLEPVPAMLPFNLLEYIIRPLSLCLRLYGNILGGFIIMVLVESLVPIIAPAALSVYFDIFDGFIQALVFTFLSTLFIGEAVVIAHHGGVQN
jgi:F-type H+-transporting ATPase subunit a